MTTNNTQLRSDGSLQHLLDIATLPKKNIEQILTKALEFSQKTAPTSLTGKTICNAFYENSTRTRCSFEIAAKRLGATVINFNVDTSAVQKGESLLDTFRTLHAMHVDQFVIRHQLEGIQAQIAADLGESAAVINAGDGCHEHPTQALLDALTILQHKPDLTKLSIAIVGDITHSRVAGSLMQIFAKLGVPDVRLIAPHTLQPETLPADNLTTTDNLSAGLQDVDVVIALRIQKERMLASEIPNFDEYFRQYGITQPALTAAKPDAIVMHPGPVNRGIDISNDVMDGPQSVILEQVANGVAVRMAVMALLCK